MTLLRLARPVLTAAALLALTAVPAAADPCHDDAPGGPIVVHLTASVLPAHGRPGETIKLDAVLGNTGPSNEYTGPAVFLFTAPEHTHWASPSGYRCTPDAAGQTLVCSYPAAPLTWRNELEQLPLTIDASATPGTTLHGGRITATDPYDPEVFHGTFGVDVTA